jgi:alkylation response protein AidB-like acyl-CoA dehydrogenase
MDFRLTSEQQALKEEFEDFYREEMKNSPPEYQEGAIELEARCATDETWAFHKHMQKLLAEKGWLAAHWPKEYGGREASIIEQLLFSEVQSYYRAPGVEPGLKLLAPTLMLFANDEQKKRLLPPIARGEVNYCQGWSEPNAGSDLAALETTAVKDGEYYIINGQKVWTTGAHRADRMFMLARSDPSQARSKGLSLFVLSMDSPGIEVRPLHYMDGAHMYNEVFFKDVRVHERDRIGEENQGWQATRATMNFERSGIGYIIQVKRRFEELVEYVKTAKRGKRLLAEIPSVRQKIARLYINIERGIALAYQAAWKQQKGDILSSAYLASESKVLGTELMQQLGNFGTEIMGPYGQLTASKWAQMSVLVDMYQWCMGGTISMGSNEIQRNIIAWVGLGLPRFK